MLRRRWGFLNPETSILSFLSLCPVSLREEQNYREVDEQLQQAQLLLEEQTKREKEYLRAQATQAKEVLEGRWDQHLRAQEISAEQDFQKSLAQLHESSRMMRLKLEEQASQLVIEYQTRRTQEELQRRPGQKTQLAQGDRGAKSEGSEHAGGLVQLQSICCQGTGELSEAITCRTFDSNLLVEKLSFCAGEVSAVQPREWLGFGGSFTEAAAETFRRMSAPKQSQIIHAYFDTRSGLGYSLGRVPIGSCDFSLGHWTCGDISESLQDLQGFSLARYEVAILPMIRTAMQQGPISLLASPWSPPAWMKSNGRYNFGGKLLPQYRGSWSQHFVRFAREMASRGVPLWGISVQNEPEAATPWESCQWTGDEEASFIRDFLGPAVRQAELDLKIVAWDHNRDGMLQRAACIYSDPDVSEYVWGIGYHWYGDPRFEWWPGRAEVNFEDALRVLAAERKLPVPVMKVLAGSKHLEGAMHFPELRGRLCLDSVRQTAELRPDKHLLFTEGCWIDWNLCLDELGGPNHAGNFCLAPIICDTRTDEVLLQPAYWFLGHFARYIRPGARRVLCSSSRDLLECTAWRNLDDTLSIVVMNQSESSLEFTLRHPDTVVFGAFTLYHNFCCGEWCIPLVALEVEAREGIYMLVLGFMLLLLSIPRFLLRLLLQPALGYFGHIVEYAYTLRICKLHVKLSRAVQKKWMRRPYHSRFSDIRTRLYPSDGGVCHVHAVPCLTDNFCYVLVSEGLGEASEARSQNGLRQGLAAVVVDPCDAAAVEEALEHIAETFYAGYGGLRLEGVLCTHKHWDHAGGNEELAARASQTQSYTDSATESESQDVTTPQLLHFAEKLKVFGGLEDDVPGCTDPVQHLDCIEIANLSFQAIGAPGHTQGSVMFRLACKAQSSETDERLDALFTGDTLFSGGCGANFEGSELDMEHCFGTILEICEPSYKTWLFPGHEYTCMLMENALVEACDKVASRPPGYFIAVCSAFYTAAHRRALRDRLPTVPVLLDGEQMVNPRFKALRRHARTLLAAAQQGEAADLSVGTAQVPAFPVPQSAPSRKIATGQKGEGGESLLVASGAPPPRQLAVLYRTDLDALRAELSAGLAGAEAAERLRQLEARPFEALLSGEADCFDDSGLKPEEEEAIKQEAAYGQPRDLPTETRPSQETEWSEVPVKDALKALAVPAHLAVGPKAG
ncbi:Gba [Symbiodinium sp. KB8]|nr:Gba [Symbiodinium sp. KB8]